MGISANPNKPCTIFHFNLAPIAAPSSPVATGSSSASRILLSTSHSLSTSEKFVIRVPSGLEIRDSDSPLVSGRQRRTGERMEKLIYVHVATLGESLLTEGLPNSGYIDATNDWYLIKQSDGGDGVELTRVFEHVEPHNGLYPAVFNTTCEVIGSCIYVIGGLSMARYHAWLTFGPYGSKEIRFLDTRNPKGQWTTCATLPFIQNSCSCAVVDDQVLYILGGYRPGPHLHRCFPGPWGYAVDLDYSKPDEERIRSIREPGSRSHYPYFSTCLSPGTLIAYIASENTLYQLDCKNSTWSVYQKDIRGLPLKSGCTSVVDDGILYTCNYRDMQFTSYDIRNKKELDVIDLPCSSWFGLDEVVTGLIVVSKNRFCIVRHSDGPGVNELQIFYTRFSVSYHLPTPAVVLEERRVFPVAGCLLLNVVAVDPHSDVSNCSSSNGRNSDAMCLDN